MSADRGMSREEFLKLMGEPGDEGRIESIEEYMANVRAAGVDISETFVKLLQAMNMTLLEWMRATEQDDVPQPVEWQVVMVQQTIENALVVLNLHQRGSAGFIELDPEQAADLLRRLTGLGEDKESKEK